MKAISRGFLMFATVVCAVGAASKPNDSELISACYNGKVEEVRTLLAAGANVNAATNDGFTPLFISSQEGHADVVKLLLTAVANVNAAAGNGATPLYMASQNGHADVVKLLLAAKASVNAATNDGVTPLYRAASKNLSEIATLLLAKGADPNAANKDGDTPLHVAAAYGHKSMVELLLSNGANPSAKSKDGTTPADFATQQGHTDVAQLLDSKPVFTTYRSERYKFSMKCPSAWRILNDTEINAIAAGMSGVAPCFAAQSPAGASISIIAVATVATAEKSFATDPESALRKQYSEFTGTPPSDWTKTLDTIRNINERKGLLVEWKMPKIQGVVLMQKHLCLIVGKMSFFISGTSDANSWKEYDAKWFSPILESFQIAD